MNHGKRQNKRTRGGAIGVKKQGKKKYRSERETLRDDKAWAEKGGRAR